MSSTTNPTPAGAMLLLALIAVVGGILAMVALFTMPLVSCGPLSMKATDFSDNLKTSAFDLCGQFGGSQKPASGSWLTLLGGAMFFGGGGAAFVLSRRRPGAASAPAAIRMAPPRGGTQASEDIESPQAAFCHGCGAKAAEGGAFCHVCGAKLATNIVPTPIPAPAASRQPAFQDYGATTGRTGAVRLPVAGAGAGQIAGLLFLIAGVGMAASVFLFGEGADVNLDFYTPSISNFVTATIAGEPSSFALLLAGLFTATGGLLRLRGIISLPSARAWGVVGGVAGLIEIVFVCRVVGFGPAYLEWVSRQVRWELVAIASVVAILGAVVDREGLAEISTVRS